MTLAKPREIVYSIAAEHLCNATQAWPPEN